MCVLFGSNYKYNIKTTRLTTLVCNVNKHVEMNHQQTADDSLLNMRSTLIWKKKEFSALLKITTALHITVPALPWHT